ncbi:hypothetical protein [Pseudonocardia zijingensis]|uniref:Uncharacterized protein n=1 Tax=Pseudonocardia zijingensis TaxID=153376 RepID=A0ABN1N8M8_9PSEU
MALTLPTDTRDAMCNTLVDRVDASGAGSLEIRSGTRPPSANDAATGTVLATVELATPAFGDSADGTATLTDPPAVTGVAAGTATWFRALDGAGATVMDGSVSATGDGGDLQLATTAITAGLTVDITGGTVTMPSGE